MNVRTITRRVAFAAAAILLTACSQAGGEEAQAVSGEYLQAKFVEEGVEYGSEDAPVTLVEYASLTCGHCKDFHENVMPRIKEDYVKTGKVKFVFREFPTPPVQIALAGFVTARCAGEAQHLNVLDDFFGNQAEIFDAVRGGQAEPALVALAGRHGLSEQQFNDCLADLDIRQAIAASIAAGEADGVNSTPTLILNGEKLLTQEARTADGLAALIDVALGAPAPIQTPVENSETEDAASYGSGK